MFKVTERGIEEFGEVIELTEEDREVILRDIGFRTSEQVIVKRDGKWRSDDTYLANKKEGFRVFEPEDGEPEY